MTSTCLDVTLTWEAATFFAWVPLALATAARAFLLACFATWFAWTALAFLAWAVASDLRACTWATLAFLAAVRERPAW